MRRDEGKIMEKQPLVSVIIPCYNGEKFISKAIESVLNQTYQNWELIVVDDGSTDGSKKIINQFCNTDKRAHYIQHKKNKGIPSARNTGIKTSIGEYIAFLDQDDLWMKEKLELFIEEFSRYDSKVGIIFSDFQIVFADNIVSKNYKKVNYYKIQRLNKRNFIKKLFMRNFIKSASQVILRKECFSKLGLLDKNLYGGDDGDFWLRAAGKFDFQYLPKILVKIYLHKDNTTRKGSYRMIEDGMNIIVPKAVEQYPFLEYLRYKKYSKLHYSYGTHLFMDGQFLKARKYFIKAIKEDFLNWKAWARLLLTFKISNN